MITTVPFWRDDAPRPDNLAVSTMLPREVDVAVVGAGFTGMNAARELVTAGKHVAVLDEGSLGSGASAVNGGMVNYGLKAATTTVFKRFGSTLGRQFWDASLASIDLVEKVVRDEGINCDFHRGGAVEMGYRDRDLATFQHEAEWLLEKVGFELEVVGPDRVRAFVDSPAFRCAMADSIGAGLHPAKYVWGLAGAIAAKGVQLVEDAAVTDVSPTRDGFIVTTSRGPLRAGQVLLATNGYTTTRPVGELRRRVVPIGSYVVVTEPLRADVAERLIPNDRVAWTARRLLNYFRRTPDNRLLMGGRNNLSTDLDLQHSADILGRTVHHVFPELAEVPITHTWSGKLGITFDLMPHIGRIDGVWYALGYGGHGVGIGTYVGSEVGKLMAGTLDRTPFAEIPHPTRPYYREKTWFLPFAAAWYRALDVIGR
jgi:glycine/D-amino acid oxidase-like deaminating enzyme